VALLEVIVAITILGIAGLAAIAASREALVTVHHAGRAQDAVSDASAFLDVVSLWTREDLDRRLGDRAQGPWRLRISRVQDSIYEVALSDSASGRVLIGTALYRPMEAQHGER
jgi:type II secretory pathway pseudopilin PulG